MDSPLAVFTELAWHSSNKEWRWIDDESQVFSKREKRFLEVTPTYVNLGKQSKSCTKTLQTVKGLTLPCGFLNTLSMGWQKLSNL